jgi:hypothetical protein
MEITLENGAIFRVDGKVPMHQIETPTSRFGRYSFTVI